MARIEEESMLFSGLRQAPLVHIFCYTKNLNLFPYPCPSVVEFFRLNPVKRAGGRRI